MSIIHLFHGTSGNCAEEIIKNGFGSSKKETVWDCSDSFKTYFYHLDKFVKCEGIEEYDIEDQINSCCQRANESGQITAAFEKNPQDKTVVFEFIIDTDKIDTSYIELDDSCENMESYGAVQVPDVIVNYWIGEGIAQVKVREYPFIVKLSLVYLSSVSKNEYLYNSLDCLSEEEVKILDVLSREHLYFSEDLSYPECIKEYSL